MPILKIFTNVPKSQISKDFMVKVIPALVDGVKKEADRNEMVLSTFDNLIIIGTKATGVPNARAVLKFTCIVQSDCLLSMDGDPTLPAVTASLESIGHLGPEQNIRISKLLTAVMQNELGVRPERFLLTFYDLEPFNVAKNGTTIAALEFCN